MFGFLSAPCSGCRTHEHSVYRAHFCGLCNRLRQDYGLPARFLVNRDATFLSLLGSAMAEKDRAPASATCCNPLGKPRPVFQDGPSVSYAAAVTICGLRAKLDDEVTDRSLLPTGFAFKGMRRAVSGPVTRAESVLTQHGFPVEDVQSALSEQTALEEDASKTCKPDLERLATPTAFTFGTILTHSNEQAKDLLNRIGQSLGHMIYILDAVVDRARDAQTSQFNPFVLQPAMINDVPDLLDQDLQTINTARQDLPLSRYQDVLDVILGPNLQRTCTTMLAADQPSKRRKKSKKKSDYETSCCDACDCCTYFDLCDCLCLDGCGGDGCDCCDCCDCIDCDCT